MEQYEELQKNIDELDVQIATFRAKGQDPAPVVFAKKMFGGRLAALQGDAVAAEAAYRESVEGFQKNEMYNEAATVALEAARFFVEKNASDRALIFCQSAIQAVDLLWWQTPLPDRLQVPPIFVQTCDIAVKVAYSQQDYGHVFDWIQLVKSRWLNDVIFLRQATQQLPLLRLFPNQDKWESELSRRRQSFHAAAARLDAGWNSYLASTLDGSQLEQLEQLVLQAYSTLSRMAFGPIRPNAATFSLTDIQSRLNSGEALVEMFVQTDGVVMLLIDKSQFKQFYQSINAEDVKDRALYTHLALIQNESRRGFNKQIQDLSDPDKQDVMQHVAGILYADPQEQLQALYDLLLKPLENDLRDVRRLIICPHWILHLIPFHAMGASIGQGDFLIKSKTITYSPSATVWARLRDAEQERPSQSSGKKLIVGMERTSGSEWGHRIHDFLNRIRGYVRLSDFESEAGDISQDLQATPILGSAATKTRVLADFTNADIIHLSCHSVLNRPNPTANGLLLADGILTIAEILTDERIGAAHPSLISVSACRSGLDRVESGDALKGIGYALLARCNCRILSSLWPVDAEATRVLMDHLFEEYEKCGEWAEALRRAQLATMQAVSRAGISGKALTFADPYFWSGFFIIGS